MELLQGGSAEDNLPQLSFSEAFNQWTKENDWWRPGDQTTEMRVDFTTPGFDVSKLLPRITLKEAV